MFTFEAQGPIDLAAAWLVNYLLHSTLLLGLAWGASRLLAGRQHSGEEWLWRHYARLAESEPR